MHRYKIIVNPVSGRGAGGYSIPIIERIFSLSKTDYELVMTEKPLHASILSRNAESEGFDVVVAVGGDGTANEVLNGLMQAKEKNGVTCSMGVVTVGRGNDFAYGANMALGLRESCHSILNGNTHTIDIGMVTGGDYPQGRYFGNGVGIGFDAVVGFTAAKMKRLSGFPSYLVSAIKTIFLYYHAPLVQIDFNEHSLQLNSLMISIMNGKRMGGGFMMAPHASTEDGLLDVCIAREVSKARIFTLIPHFLRGTQATQAEIQTYQAGKICVTALKGSLPVHADGETICTEGHQLQFELLPKQLDIICMTQRNS